jgi:hypothetical protein
MNNFTSKIFFKKKKKKHEKLTKLGKEKFQILPFQDLICFLNKLRKTFQGLTTARHNSKMKHQNKIVRCNKAKQQGVIGD